MSELIKSIFREYDIRGIFPDELNKDSIAKIAKSIAYKCLEESVDEVVIARDGRLSGPSLLDSLQKSLNAYGINTINLGLATSPLLYYAAKKQVSKSGIMITGSHNPKNYNGIKLVIDDKPVSGTEIFELSKTDISSGDSKGKNRFLDIKEDYINEVKNSFNFKKLKVVIDCGNGAAGIIAPDLLRAVGCEVVEIFCDVDGNFPNHHPDPGKEKNIVDLIKKVKEVSADVGIAFDGSFKEFAVRLRVARFPVNHALGPHVLGADGTHADLVVLGNRRREALPLFSGGGPAWTPGADTINDRQERFEFLLPFAFVIPPRLDQGHEVDRLTFGLHDRKDFFPP